MLVVQLALIAAGLLGAVGVNAQVQATFWPATGPGEPLVAQAPDAELAALMAEVSPKRIQATIEKLVSFGTRHTLSTQTDPTRGIGAARDWIALELRSYGGRLEVSTPSYIQEPVDRVPEPTNITDVIATLPGTVDPNRVYLISGHYDSRVSDPLNGEDDAPGADDDASGVAVLMELARVMANKVTVATIVFAAVAGEEQGLLGADFLAKQLKSQGVDLQGMLNNDIVGSSTGPDGQTDPFNIRMFAQGIPPTQNLSEIQTRVAVGGENDYPTRQLGRFISEVSSNNVTGMNVRMIYRLDRYGRGGDHRPFLEQGFPAVRFTEPHENYNHQHQDVRVENGIQYGDLMEYLDYEFTARVARVNGVALWSLAQAPGTPQNVRMNSSQSIDSGVTWSTDPQAAGYEIVWRPSMYPTWTNVVDVGCTGSTRVDLSKDNAQFGVRAVGANGYRSPVGFAS